MPQQPNSEDENGSIDIAIPTTLTCPIQSSSLILSSDTAIITQEPALVRNTAWPHNGNSSLVQNQRGNVSAETVDKAAAAAAAAVAAGAKAQIPPRLVDLGQDAQVHKAGTEATSSIDQQCALLGHQGHRHGAIHVGGGSGDALGAGRALAAAAAGVVEVELPAVASRADKQRAVDLEAF